MTFYWGLFYVLHRNLPLPSQPSFNSLIFSLFPPSLSLSPSLSLLSLFPPSLLPFLPPSPSPLLPSPPHFFSFSFSSPSLLSFPFSIALARFSVQPS